MQRRGGETRGGERCGSIAFRTVEFEDECRWEGYRWEDEPVRCAREAAHPGWCRNRHWRWQAGPGARAMHYG